MDEPLPGKRAKPDTDEIDLPQRKSLATQPVSDQPQHTVDAEMQEHSIESLIAHTFLPPPPAALPRNSHIFAESQRLQEIMNQVYSYENQVKNEMTRNHYATSATHIPDEINKWRIVAERYPDVKELIRKAVLLGDYDASTIAGYLGIANMAVRDRIILC